MLAVLRTGGKQYIVRPGDVISIERLNKKAGESVVFEEVLTVEDDDGNVSVGTPTVPGVTVKGEVLEETKGPKVVVFKFRRRKGYRRKKGHRQLMSTVRIVEITR